MAAEENKAEPARPFVCKVCGFRAITQPGLIAHQIAKHPAASATSAAPSGDNDSLIKTKFLRICPICGLEMSDLKSFIEHLNSGHGVNEPGPFLGRMKTLEAAPIDINNLISPSLRRELERKPGIDELLGLRGFSTSRDTTPRRPLPPPPEPEPEEPWLEKTRRLLEEGRYAEALELGRNADAIAVKNKIIEIRENHSELSKLLVAAEDALIKDRRKYEKDRKIQDDIIKRVARKTGGVAVELFSVDMLWKMVREKAMLPDKLADFVTERVLEASKELSVIEYKKYGEIKVYSWDKNCLVCHGTPGKCTYCNGSGRLNTRLVGNEIFSRAKYDSQLRKFVKQKHIKKPPSFFPTALMGYREPEVSFTESCPTCRGQGTVCSCMHEVIFKIPSNARPGMVVKGQSRVKRRPFYARLASSGC